MELLDAFERKLGVVSTVKPKQNRPKQWDQDNAEDTASSKEKHTSLGKRKRQPLLLPTPDDGPGGFDAWLMALGLRKKDAQALRGAGYDDPQLLVEAPLA